MKSVSYLIISIFLFFSCKSQELKQVNLIVFNKINEVSLKNNNYLETFPYSFRQINDSIYITFSSVILNQLVTYSLSTGKVIEEIPIDFFKNNYLIAFNYLNKDSIFLAFNASAISDNSYHDSSLMMINNEGKIKKIFDLKNSYVRCSYNNFSVIDSFLALPAPFTEISYVKNKLYFSFIKFKHKPGDSISEAIKLPIAGHYDLVNDKIIMYNDLNEVPYFKKGRNYHKLNKIVQVILSNDSLPIIAFGHTPLIYKYDYFKRSKNSYMVKSILVDTIKPNNVCENGLCKDYYNAFYCKIYYDKFRKLYYRFVRLPAKADDNAYRKNHQKISMIIADTSFNIIAEGILPDNLSDLSLIISNEGLWFHNSKDKENITYELYSVNYTKGIKKDLVEQYNEKTEIDNKSGILTFMNDNFNINSENSAIVFVPSDLGCKSCASTISKFYTDNQNLFKNRNLFFVVAGLSKYTVDYFLEQNGIKPGMPNVFIDNKGVYLNYIESFNNPKLFVLENGKVKFEKVYKPAELLELELKIKEYSEK